jgi:hypothetical protein
LAPMSAEVVSTAFRGCSKVLFGMPMVAGVFAVVLG